MINIGTRKKEILNQKEFAIKDIKYGKVHICKSNNKKNFLIRKNEIIANIIGDLTKYIKEIDEFTKQDTKKITNIDRFLAPKNFVVVIDLGIDKSKPFNEKKDTMFDIVLLGLNWSKNKDNNYFFPITFKRFSIEQTNILEIFEYKAEGLSKISEQNTKYCVPTNWNTYIYKKDNKLILDEDKISEQLSIMLFEQ